VDVNIVELSLTGQMAAIGFSDQLRITQIFMDDLNVSFLFNYLILILLIMVLERSDKLYLTS